MGVTYLGAFTTIKGYVGDSIVVTEGGGKGGNSLCMLGRHAESCVHRVLGELIFNYNPISQACVDGFSQIQPFFNSHYYLFIFPLGAEALCSMLW